MAHKRKDTLVAAPEWWRHLRPGNKRRVAKQERRAANRIIQDTHENQVHPAEDLRRANHPPAASANRGSKAGRTRRPRATSGTRNAPNNNSGKVGFDNSMPSAARNRFRSRAKLVGIPKRLPPAFSARHRAVAGLNERGSPKLWVEAC